VVTVLGFVWTLPNTVIGLLLGALTFQRPRYDRGVLLFDRTPRGLSRLLRRMGRSAMTVGFVVIGTERVDGTLLAHEKRHVAQYCRWGPFFLPVYGALYLRYGYGRHPFEVAAARGTTLP
jgi:hypothetical protein